MEHVRSYLNLKGYPRACLFSYGNRQHYAVCGCVRDTDVGGRDALHHATALPQTYVHTRQTLLCVVPQYHTACSTAGFGPAQSGEHTVSNAASAAQHARTHAQQTRRVPTGRYRRASDRTLCPGRTTTTHPTPTAHPHSRATSRTYRIVLENNFFHLPRDQGHDLVHEFGALLLLAVARPQLFPVNLPRSKGWCGVRGVQLQSHREAISTHPPLDARGPRHRTQHRRIRSPVASHVW